MDVRGRAVEELVAARQRSLDLLEGLSDDQLTAQHSPLMSPLVWDLAHVGNYEGFGWSEPPAGWPPSTRRSTTSTTPSAILGPTGPPSPCSDRRRPGLPR